MLQVGKKEKKENVGTRLNKTQLYVWVFGILGGKSHGEMKRFLCQVVYNTNKSKNEKWLVEIQKS